MDTATDRGTDTIELRQGAAGCLEVGCFFRPKECLTAGSLEGKLTMPLGFLRFQCQQLGDCRIIQRLHGIHRVLRKREPAACRGGRLELRLVSMPRRLSLGFALRKATARIHEEAHSKK